MIKQLEYIRSFVTFGKYGRKIGNDSIPPMEVLKAAQAASSILSKNVSHLLRNPHPHMLTGKKGAARCFANHFHTKLGTGTGKFRAKAAYDDFQRGSGSAGAGLANLKAKSQ